MGGKREQGLGLFSYHYGLGTRERKNPLWWDLHCHERHKFPPDFEPFSMLFVSSRDIRNQFPLRTGYEPKSGGSMTWALFWGAGGKIRTIFGKRTSEKGMTARCQGPNIEYKLQIWENRLFPFFGRLCIFTGRKTRDGKKDEKRRESKHTTENMKRCVGRISDPIVVLPRINNFFSLSLSPFLNKCPHKLCPLSVPSHI